MSEVYDKFLERQTINRKYFRSEEDYKKYHDQLVDDYNGKEYLDRKSG
ncbi:MAG: hypothetical protein MRJ93_02715 [Nitrososphaeraceae archaeon]|nr:hypothetical protein [Nitrososphaeraceae archaeon]